MFRIRFVLLGMLTVLALGGAAASATASAHSYKIEGKTIGAGAKEEVLVSSGTGEFESVLLGTKILITCQEDLGSAANNAIESEGKSKFKVEFKNGCLMSEIKEGKKTPLASCVVAEPVKAEGEDLLVGTNGFPEEEFKEKESKAFSIISITGCALESKTEVKGGTVCALPEASVEEVSHEIVCTGVGSKLKYGKEAAFLYSTETITTSKLEKFSSE
jgi:hypothetical protein